MMWMNNAAAAAGRFAGRLLGVTACCQWWRTLCNRWSRRNRSKANRSEVLSDLLYDNTTV